MGTTIHYEGVAERENVVKILRIVEDYARSSKWKININEANSIMVSPHPDSESIVIRFNVDQKFSGFVKTGLAPTDIHKQVVKLFYEIEPLLKRLAIEDDSGYWLEYIEKASEPSAKELMRFPELSEKDVIKSELLQLPIYASELDRNFWNTNPIFSKPFMYVPAVRNRMGYDLLNGQYILTAKEMGHILANEGFTVTTEDWKNEIFYLIHLATLWAWKHSTGLKNTKTKRNKCIAFAWTIARGCYGFSGGFLNQTHRRAHIAIDNLEQKEGEISPVRSLEILYSLFDFVGLRSLSSLH